MLRQFLAVAIVLAGLPLLAQENPPVIASTGADWLQKPYHLTLVFHVDPHPIMTPEFIDQMTKEIADLLQSDLGATAKVDVQNSSNNLMNKVLRSGWTALDGPQALSDRKQFLVRVTYQDGDYEVSARQVDGDTGVVSPLRRSRTSDRQWLARQTALMLAQDFGMTAELQAIPGVATNWKMNLRGARLGKAETIRLGAGDVFNVVKVTGSGPDAKVERVPDAVLYITSTDDRYETISARLYHSFGAKSPMQNTRNSSYRAIKLGTKTVPLSLKLVDKETGQPLTGYEVRNFPSGFDNGSANSLGASNGQGNVKSSEPIKNVAFVRIMLGGVGKYDVPIPLLDENQVLVQIGNTQAFLQLEEIKFEHERWRRRYNQILAEADVEYQIDVANKMRQGKEKEALAGAKKLLPKLKADIDELKPETDRVRKLAQAMPAAAKIVEDINNAEAALDKFHTGLETFVKDIESPTEDKILIKKAQLAEDALDFDEAIKLYNQAFKINPNTTPAIRNRVKEMIRLWNNKNPELLAARKYFKEVWLPVGERRLDWQSLEKELVTANKQFDAVQINKDYLTCQVADAGIKQYVKQLIAVRETLSKNVTAETVDTQVQLDRTIDALAAFEKKVIQSYKEATQKDDADK